jgi:hypothetical protein
MILTLQIAFLASPLFIAALANGLCLRYECLTFLKKPLDFGLLVRGRRVLGDNKTWRGAFLNVVFCIVGAWIQSRIQRGAQLPTWLPLCDYGRLWLPVGMALGLGATLGELPNSFLKRQLGIQPGKRRGGALSLFLFLYDQVDLAIGVWIFLYPVIRPSFRFILWSTALTIPLHLLISLVGYGLGMRKTLT